MNTPPTWPTLHAPVLRVAVLGAPRSGKTTLWRNLHARLQAHGWAVTAVAASSDGVQPAPEGHGPQAPLTPATAAPCLSRQRAHAQTLIEALAALATRPTRPAALLVDDPPLLAESAAADPQAARRFDAGWDLRLLMGLDGTAQRDAQAAERLHQEADHGLRAQLQRGQLAHTVLYGPSTTRLEAAWHCLRAAAGDPPQPVAPTWRAACDCCADPVAERALFSRLLAPGSAPA
jgi:hypothetical protein